MVIDREKESNGTPIQERGRRPAPGEAVPERSYNRSLIEASLDPFVTIDPDGTIRDVNEATVRVTGMPRDQLIGTDFSMYFTEPAKAKIGYEAAFRDGSVRDYGLELRHRDGTLTPVIYNATVFRDERDDVAGVFAAARDITRQKQAEEELRYTGAYNRSLIEASLDPLVTISPDGTISDVNKATIRVTGVPRDELIGTDFSTYFTDPDRAKRGYEAAFETGVVTDYELELRRRDGTVTPVLYNATVFRDEAGEVAGVFAAARDITERKKAEESWSRLAAIVDSSDDAIIGKSLDGTIVSWNPAAQKIYGYVAPEIVGRHVSKLVPPEQVAEIDGILARVRRGEHVHHYETIRIRSDGNPINISLTLSPIRSPDGRIVGASTIARDITAWKQGEEALRAASAYNRSLIEASLDPLVTINLDGKISDVNAATIRATGRSRYELIGTDFSTYFTEPEKAKAGYEAAFKSGQVRDYELELHHRNGTATPVLYNATVFRNEACEMIGVFAAARDITARKKAEEATRQRGVYNRSLIEASLDPLVTIDPDGSISDVNEATVAITGTPRDELIGTDFSDYFTDPEKAKAGYEAVFRDGSVRDYELELRHRNGTVTPVLYNATVFRDERGEVAGVFAAARDITERKKAEGEWSRLAAIVDSSDDAIIGKTLDGTIVSWNPAAKKIYGYSASEILGKPLSLLVQPDQIDEVESILDRVRRGEPVEHYETVRIKKDGSPIDVSLTLSPIRDSGGSIVGASTIARDITERKRAEEAVLRASAYNRSLIEVNLDPLVTITPDGTISDVNEATVDATGIARDELIGTDFSDYFTDPVKAKAGYETAFRTGAVRDYELELRHRNGTVTPVLYNATVFRDERGEMAGVFAAARDITERKKAEEAVRHVSAYNRSLIEASLDPLVTINPDGRISDVNKATILATGVSRESLIGTRFPDYFTDPGKARAGYEAAFRKGSVTDYELELRHRDGTVTPVLYNAAAFRDERGEMAGIFAAARDVTERKQAEAALLMAYDELDDRVKERTADLVEANRNLEREIAEHKATASKLQSQSQKLARSNEELQRFAYVASHDLQEPLRSIVSFSQLLERRYKGQLDSDADDYIAFIVEGGNRMQKLIMDLLQFSRIERATSEFRPTDSAEIVADALRALEVQLAEVDARVAVGPLPVVTVDATQLEHVFLNLIGNAIKYRRPEVPPDVRISAVQRDDQWEFSVQDNGIGIEPEYFDRIFEMFRRLHTRDRYDGTGIGLAVVKKIVDRHGGRCWVESVPGDGSTFFFTLPIAREAGWGS